MVDQPCGGQRRDQAADVLRTVVGPGRSAWTDGAVASGLVQDLRSIKNMESRPDGRGERI